MKGDILLFGMRERHTLDKQRVSMACVFAHIAGKMQERLMRLSSEVRLGWGLVCAGKLGRGECIDIVILKMKTGTHAHTRTHAHAHAHTSAAHKHARTRARTLSSGREGVWERGW